MNIYLTSYGIDTIHKEYMNCYNDIINLLSNKKVAIIPNARLSNQNRESSQNIKKELELNNINALIIDLEKQNLNTADYDALYFSGGEPKYLMDSIYKSNKFNDIQKFINKGGIVIGQSAGAMIFNKEYIDTSTGKLMILNNGFDFTNKIIVPHFENLPKDFLEKLPKNIIIVKDCDKLIKLN